MKYKKFSQYYKRVMNIVGASEASNGWAAIQMEINGKLAGVIKADPLVFHNADTLRFKEESRIEDGNIITIKYAFHFEKADGTYFFRYDKDSEHAVPIVHEECHLHVNAKSPRFKTHSTSFIEIFNFIVMTFQT